MMFLYGKLQPTLRAVAENNGGDACREGYHGGSTDFLGGDRVGRILGNRAVEYGQND
jgi:hypothetical protein